MPSGHYDHGSLQRVRLPPSHLVVGSMLQLLSFSHCWLPSDGGEKSGDPDLRPEVLQHSSSFIHSRRPDVAATFSFPWCCPWTVERRAAILTFVQSFFSIPPSSIAVGPTQHPFFPAVLTLDGVEQSGRPDPRTFFTNCNCRHICRTRSEHVLTCGKYVFVPASPATEVGVPLEGLRLHPDNNPHVHAFGQIYIPL